MHAAWRGWVLGGVIVALGINSAGAQPRGGFGRFGGLRDLLSSGPMLLAMNEVREELGVNPEQNAKLDQILNTARENLFGEVDFLELQELEGEELEEAMTEIRQAVDKVAGEATTALGEVLDAEQLARLEQLRLQREGVRALLRADVAEALVISPEQQTKIKEVLAAAEARSEPPRDFRELSDEERQQLFAEMRQRREALNAEVLAVLTPDQQADWKTRQGEPFEFPRGGGGFLGGFGRPGGGGPGGAGGRGPGGRGPGSGGGSNP